VRRRCDASFVVVRGSLQLLQFCQVVGDGGIVWVSRQRVVERSLQHHHVGIVQRMVSV